ncbi:alpha-D-ribose 1-methylphosphonate 5-phosphate C-P-lyase PhnJ [Ancylobacter dichloromethanicus]|nr:alpha-D-ribose 1-methylphosphonate 5-phosphate C-P-lyase PhnJ [Ancylobacter dichloromethanicus]
MTTTSAYPMITNGRHLMSPTPIPTFDNPKMADNPAIQLFGAGREKRIYAAMPYTSARSLDFDGHPFTPRLWKGCCARCRSTDSDLDEVLTDDKGGRMFLCSDTDHCAKRRAGAAEI